MTADSQPWISQWIIAQKEGRSQAIDALWERYFEKLVRLGRGGGLAGSLPGGRRRKTWPSAFLPRSAMPPKKGDPRDLADRDDLWRLLITITAQKAIDQRRHDGRAKRGGGRVRGESARTRSTRASLSRRLLRSTTSRPRTS